MNSHKVIRSYLIIAGLYTLSASLIWGIGTFFLLDAGLDIFGVFIANAVFTGSMALFEIPTGVLADTRGRRTSFLLSVVIVLIGTLGYVGVAAIGGGLFLFCVMSVVLGLGYTFYSGAVEAWLVDALNATAYEGELDHVFARGAMVTGAAMLVGSVGGGFLGSVNLAIPYLLRSLLLAFVFVVAFFTMHDIGFAPRALTFSQMPGEMRQVARASITYGWQNRSVRLLMIVSFIQLGFVAWGFYAWQPYFLELLGQDAIWIAGVIAALVSLATILGNTLVDWFTRFCGKRTTLLLWATAVHGVAIIGVGMSTSFWWAVGLYLVAMITLGVAGPVKQSYLHHLIPTEQRATVVSFDSLFGSAGSMIGQGALGYLAQVRSISAAFVVGGAYTLLAVPALFSLRKLGGSADVIIGTAGSQGACAAQGLPQTAGLDTVAREGALVDTQSTSA